ncbi:MAG: hypothetical protein WAL87_03365 [Chthoniobacterales bacterium]
MTLQIIIPKGGTKPLVISKIVPDHPLEFTHWTDGKSEESMLPDRERLFKSFSEDLLFWTGEWEIVQSINTSGTDTIEERWSDARCTGDILKEDYYRAIAEGMADNAEKLLYLRKAIWWAENDPFRHGETKEPQAHDRQNLEQILKMMDLSNPDDLLCAAEIHRELSQFSNALSLLEREIPDEHQMLSQAIRERALAEDPAVVPLAVKTPWSNPTKHPKTHSLT